MKSPLQSAVGVLSLAFKTYLFLSYCVLFVLTSCWSSLWMLILSSGMAFISPPLLISTDLIRIESIFIQGLNKVNKTGQEQSSRAHRICLVLSQYKKLPVALSFSLPVSLWTELAGERAGHALWQWWAWPKQSPRAHWPGSTSWKASHMVSCPKSQEEPSLLKTEIL